MRKRPDFAKMRVEHRNLESNNRQTNLNTARRLRRDWRAAEIEDTFREWGEELGSPVEVMRSRAEHLRLMASAEVVINCLIVLKVRRVNFRMRFYSNNIDPEESEQVEKRIKRLSQRIEEDEKHLMAIREEQLTESEKWAKPTNAHMAGPEPATS